MVLWLDFQKIETLALTFTKSLCLVLLRPAETSLMQYGYIETNLLKSCSLWRLQTYFTKITNALGLGVELSNVCTKLEPARSKRKPRKSNEILQINVGQNFSPCL